MRKPERKYIEAPLSVEEDGRTVSGYAAVFGNVDWDRDVIHAGAFTKTLSERRGKVRVLWQHDANRPLGPLLEIGEDGIGLAVRFRISPTTYGEDALTLVREKALDGISIAYDVLDDYMARGSNGDEPIRHITAMRLWEVSLVTFPANERATVTGVKMVSGATNWPLADRDREWDAADARQRIQAWATRGEGEEEGIDWSQYQKTHFWYDSDEPELLGSYKLPFCDIIDGRPFAIPRAIFAVAGALMGARGGVDIPVADADAVKRRVATYYARMRREFDDDGILVPWEAAASKGGDVVEEADVGSKSVGVGSIEGQLDRVHRAFHAEFTEGDSCPYWIIETHEGYLLVESELPNAEFPVYLVPYSVEPTGEIAFLPRPDWAGGALRFTAGVKSLALTSALSVYRKEGRVLSSRNVDLLRTALEALQAIWDDAEHATEPEGEYREGVVGAMQEVSRGAEEKQVPAEVTTSDEPKAHRLQPEPERAEPPEELMALTRRRQQLRMRLLANSPLGADS